MAITSEDIEFRLSTKSGAAGDSQASTSAASLGKYMSTTEITDASLHNLFDLITGDENAAEDIEYRCFFVYNTHETLTWEGVKVWLSDEVAGGADAAIAVDQVAASDHDESDPQANEIADEDTAPDGESFSAPTSKEAGLDVGDLGPGKCRAIWVRRTATDSGPVDEDGVTISFAGDTAA